MKNLSKSILVPLFFAGAAVAAGMITINSGKPPYNQLSNIVDTSATSEEAVRVAGLSQIVGTYRATHGLSTLPTGTVFRVIWPDGTSERAQTGSRGGSVQATPVPGTQTGFDGGAGGGGGDSWIPSGDDPYLPSDPGRGGVNCNVALVIGCA